ncbi:MAG: type II toxin-antitoxin system RelE/ParE family toxin [Candidatus Omnitrophota bacterium]
MYKVKFPNTSIERKFYKELNVVQPKVLQDEIIDVTLSLAGDPRPKGEPKIKPPLEVYSYTAQYRISIKNYRVLYDVNDKIKTVWILALRKRNERTYV